MSDETLRILGETNLDAPRARRPSPPGQPSQVWQDLIRPREDRRDDAIEFAPELPKVAPGKRLLPGGDWILDAPVETPAVWGGASGTVAWSKGEGLMLVGPEGVGKSTLAQQLVLARIGLRRRLFGMRVEKDPRPVLYIAADRPRQVQRSFARMVGPENRQLLNDRLQVWNGPLPFDVASEPHRLSVFCDGFGTVFADSLKDIALDLTKDETGSRVNNAFQELIANEIELCVLHHQRKGSREGAKPKKLEDVYGSRWLTAGMGSVLLVWGEPGDLVVDLTHLKQPSEEVGPLQLLHDHKRGNTELHEQINLLDLARVTGSEGLLVYEAAKAMFRTEQPDRNEVEKARRRMERLVDEGLMRRDDSQAPKAARYFQIGQRA